ncbi:MAG: Ppx/GppA family phosphatase [Verrucomicrobiae bacterium]|nr:Ppx/GppA family phosphatase [Verrucomicrobiae bacterium]
MRYAVIDVGTNTVKLLVADHRDDDVHPLLEDARTTRVGQDVARNGNLLPEAIERTVAAVSEFVTRAKELHPQHFLAYATSAVRDSTNRDEFLLSFRAATGFDCNVISGDEEAELIFLGATSSKTFRERDVAVFDIGGGSIEFIYGRRGRIDFKTSLDCGAVRMTETFLKTDPPTENELNALRDRLSTLRDLRTRMRLSDSIPLLGTGGTISTLAAMDMGIEKPVSTRIDGHRFSLPHLREMANTLSQCPLEQRKQLRGLNPQRADIIVAGAITLVAGVEALGRNELTVSARNLRHGAILKHTAGS